MIREHDLVVLTRDVRERALRARDVGAVVGLHEGGGYEVEFVSAAGGTLAVLTLTDTEDHRTGLGERSGHAANTGDKGICEIDAPPASGGREAIRALE